MDVVYIVDRSVLRPPAGAELACAARSAAVAYEHAMSRVAKTPLQQSVLEKMETIVAAIKVIIHEYDPDAWVRECKVIYRQAIATKKESTTIEMHHPVMDVREYRLNPFSSREIAERRLWLACATDHPLHPSDQRPFIGREVDAMTSMLNILGKLCEASLQIKEEFKIFCTYVDERDFYRAIDAAGDVLNAYPGAMYGIGNVSTYKVGRDPLHKRGLRDLVGQMRTLFDEHRAFFDDLRYEQDEKQEQA